MCGGKKQPRVLLFLTSPPNLIWTMSNIKCGTSHNLNHSWEYISVSSRIQKSYELIQI
jgi:hypothetical protein